MATAASKLVRIWCLEPTAPLVVDCVIFLQNCEISGPWKDLVPSQQHDAVLWPGLHLVEGVSLYKQLEPFAEVAGLAIGDPAGQRFSSTEKQQYTTITTIGHEC